MSKIKKISRYPIPNIESLPLDLQSEIMEVQEKAGFIPKLRNQKYGYRRKPKKMEVQEIDY